MSNQERSPSIADLRPDPKNANKGSERGRAMVEASLQECGAGRSILADRDGVVIAGNKTLEAALKLGLPVKIVESAGDELVVVRRNDLDLATDEKARRLAYLDNRASELGLEWDCEQLLADLQGGVDLSSIFERPELDALLSAVLQREGLCDPDAVPEVPEQPASRLGDVWIMGDSAIASAVAMPPTLSWSSVCWMAGSRVCWSAIRPTAFRSTWSGATAPCSTASALPSTAYMQARAGISGDQVADWSAAFALVPSLEVAYVWHADRAHARGGLGLERIGFEICVSRSSGSRAPW